MTPRSSKSDIQSSEGDGVRPGKHKEKVVFYDGVCALCNRSVQFILKNDHAGNFKFAPIQSEAARSKGVPYEGLTPYSIFYYEEGILLEKSDAVLRIALGLRSPWKFLAYFRYVPRTLRDAIYDWVAAHRYDWFGKYESCPMPTSEVRERWLKQAFSEVEESGSPDSEELKPLAGT